MMANKGKRKLSEISTGKTAQTSVSIDEAEKNLPSCARALSDIAGKACKDALFLGDDHNFSLHSSRSLPRGARRSFFFPATLLD